ncbi:MAG TPA: hypothetical protein VK722_18275 [Candidatus Aquilonibacter sp.]|jgi:hypothetical protein|nr:hypothetical protein [Candidatus Aquilonibacter sp.]
MNQPIKVKGVVIGHLVDGDFVPLQPTAPTVPPAPEGEALDKLIDDCCHWIEQSVGTFKKRLAPELQPDNDGRSSLTLAEGKNRWGGSAGHGGVKSWIVDGNIRSPEQIRKPINDFLDAMAQRVRVKRHIDPNWKLDNDAMAVLSSRFGIKDAPKTFDELYALKEGRRLGAERQQAERDAEFKRRNAEWQASPEGLAFAEKMRVDEFKREQVKIVMDALFPLERIPLRKPDDSESFLTVCLAQFEKKRMVVLVSCVRFCILNICFHHEVDFREAFKGCCLD